MAIVAATKPHPIFLAGRWVESPDILTVANPADAANPAGSSARAGLVTSSGSGESTHLPARKIGCGLSAARVIAANSRPRR